MVQDGDHSSGTGVATGLKRPTRSACPSGPKGGPPLKRNLFGLAPGGGCRAMPVARHAGGLLPHRFTLTRHRCGRRAVCSLWPFPWGRPRSPLATSLPCGVRTFLHRPTAGTCGNLLGKPPYSKEGPGRRPRYQPENGSGHPASSVSLSGSVLIGSVNPGSNNLVKRLLPRVIGTHRRSGWRTSGHCVPFAS